MKGKGKLEKASDVVHCEPKRKNGGKVERKSGGSVEMKADGEESKHRADRAPRKRGGSVGSPLSMPQIPVNKNPQKTKNY